MVSVDTVYQRVLAISNKEQRGYITPQEFNLLANQAQMTIFEQYFYDINLADTEINKIGGNDTEYSDKVRMIEEKINIFERSINSTTSALITVTPSTGLISFPIHYRLGSLFYKDTNTVLIDTEIEKVRLKDAIKYNRSPLAKPTLNRPICVIKEPTTLLPNGWAQTYPIALDATTVITCNYTARPLPVIWGYVISGSGDALYNVGSSANFELHEAEESLLVFKILELAGIILNKPGFVQLAGNEEAQILTQQKQ